MNWLVGTLRTYPEIAIFIALAAGFFIGNLKFGKFSLGSVTGVLLAGVLLGQLHLTISPNVKSVFFLMFLFAVGYSVGPQFFRGLKSDGISYALFAVVLCVSCLVCAVVAAKVAGYHVGQAAGLLSGACTISAVLGVATDAINQLPKSADEKKALLDSMPVAYAVTYLFGTAGSAWFLASIGPKLLGGNLVEECRKLESEMGEGEREAGVVSAYARFVARAYRLTDARFFGKPVEEFERHLASLPGHRRGFVERVRHNGGIEEATPTTMLREGDVIAVAGQRDLLLEAQPSIGPEVNDRDVLDFEAEVLDVVVTNREFDGRTLREIVNSIEGSLVRGVFLRKLLRLSQEMPVSPGTTLQQGDVAQIVGSRGNVERAAKVLGYPDRPTDRTNVEMLGLGIALGALVGALSITVGHIPLSLSTSGG
ncbi:MAG: aspartate-alanine antiporter, partial [Planctomycetota bacterium]